MEEIVSTIVEDAPKGVFLAATYYHENRKDDKGDTVMCASLLRPYKKVTLFDSEGEMEVRYYTENEWNGMERYYGKDRKPGFLYHPVRLDHNIFLRYLNECLEYTTLVEMAEYITKGESEVELDDLSQASKDLIKYVMDWDAETPFNHRESVYQQKQESDVYYYVECFKFPR